MPRQSRDMTQQTEIVGKEKRKPVRRDPEKRRQQNLQAQRKYREKLRGRLNYLETLAASTAQNHAITKAPAASTQVVGSSRTAVNSVAKSSLTYGPPCTTISSSSSWVPVDNYQPPILPSDGTSLLPAAWETATHVLPLEYDLWDPRKQISQQNNNPSVPNIWTSTYIAQAHSPPVTSDLWGMTNHSSRPDITPSTSSICDSTALVSQSNSTSPELHRASTGYATYINPSLLMRDKNHDVQSSCWMSAIDCGCPSPHLQIRTKIHDSLRPNECKTSIIKQSAGTVDLYTNNLRIETVCTLAALDTLRVHVGITMETLCGDACLSPFFRQSADHMGRSVQKTLTTLKPDLRPTSEQITIQHHPYIDILPFPTLRKNLITHQEHVDEDELLYDLLAGLVCWGGAGIGKRDRQISTEYASTGTPWDFRSWEAKGWFLKKYWNLLGGEDGELVRQSEWYRSIRGDDTSSTELHS